MSKKHKKKKRFSTLGSLFAFLVVLIVVVLLVLTSTESPTYDSPVFDRPFIEDSDRSVLVGDSVILPRSDLVIRDFVDVDGREYSLSGPQVNSFLVRKFADTTDAGAKINYAFKNVGRDKDLKFIWKVSVPEVYDTVLINGNKLTLGDSFSLRGVSRIDLQDNDVTKYYLTFDDVVIAFGSASVDFDSVSRVLTWWSESRTISRIEE